MNTRENYVPKDAIKHFHESGIEVYFFESHGRLCAVGFAGKQVKPRLYHYYQDADTRIKRVSQWIEAQQKNIEEKKNRKDRKTAEKRAFIDALKPGSILSGSWGYEQTNVEFYIVLAVKGVIVTLQELGHIETNHYGHGMACDVMPNIDVRGETITCRVGSHRIKVNSSISLGLWDGKKQYKSWYA